MAQFSWPAALEHAVRRWPRHCLPIPQRNAGLDLGSPARPQFPLVVEAPFLRTEAISFLWVCGCRTYHLVETIAVIGHSLAQRPVHADAQKKIPDGCSLHRLRLSGLNAGGHCSLRAGCNPAAGSHGSVSCPGTFRKLSIASQNTTTARRLVVFPGCCRQSRYRCKRHPARAGPPPAPP